MLKGEIYLKGDKSISHRAIILASIIRGKSKIKNLSECADVQATIKCLQDCHVNIIKQNDSIAVYGGTLSTPNNFLNAKNSGSTVRMLLGLLAGQNIPGNFIGDDSLSARPMKRVIDPLLKLGCEIKSNNNYLPIYLKSGVINSSKIYLKLPSAQVKTAVLLSGLKLDNMLTVDCEFESRDHTERLLKHLKFDFSSYNNVFKIKNSKHIKPFNFHVPGDISNASFIIAAALLMPNSEIIIKDTLDNYTRNGFLEALISMGAKIKKINKRIESNENICDLKVSYTKHLTGIVIKKEQLIRMIDEVPIFAVIASQAQGTSEIKGGEELRLKESDRLAAICKNFKLLGVNIDERKDGFKIVGKKINFNHNLDYRKDHRIEMAFNILYLIIKGKMPKNIKYCNISFPEFPKLINSLIA